MPLLLLDTRLAHGSLIAGCEEQMDPAGTGSFYNEGEADIVVEQVRVLLAAGILREIFDNYFIRLSPSFCSLLLSIEI